MVENLGNYGQGQQPGGYYPQGEQGYYQNQMDNLYESYPNQYQNQNQYPNQYQDEYARDELAYNFYNQMQADRRKSAKYDYLIILFLVLMIFVLGVYELNIYIHSSSVYIDMSKSTNSLLLSKEEIYSGYKSVFNQFGELKLQDPHVRKISKDLSFVLYDNYLFIYTPYRASFIKTFDYKNPVIRKVRAILNKSDLRSYKFPYTKNGVKGFYYLTVTETGILPYVMFVEGKRPFMTFREMRNYIGEHKQEWLKYNSKKMLVSKEFSQFMNNNEVYLTVPKNDKYWDENSNFVDPRASRLLRIYIRNQKSHNK